MWDASNFTLLMLIPGLDEEQQIGCMQLHAASDSLMLFTSRPQIWRFKTGEQPGVMTFERHKEALLDVCVDSFQFHQALCLDPSGLLTLWSLGAGEQSFSVYVAPPASQVYGEPPQNPTAVSFDSSFRRLLVGFSRGACRVYNYSNGSVIHDLLSDASAEIKAITMTPNKGMREELLIASGWNCVTWVWASKSTEYNIHMLYKLVPRGNVDKMDSLSCQLVVPSSTLFTGSLDGQVCLCVCACVCVRVCMCVVSASSTFLNFVHW